MPTPAVINRDHLKQMKPYSENKIPRVNHITAIIPTIADSPTLYSAVRTIQLQNVYTEIKIIDTGSTLQDLQTLINTFNTDPTVTIYHIEARPWEHLSERVAAAIDLGISQVETPFFYLTHDDVWIKRADFLSDLLKVNQEMAEAPVGYEMSSRSHITEQWRGMLSHTATLFKTDYHFRHRLRWSLKAAFMRKETEIKGAGWPDTETNIGLLMKDQNLQPIFIGHETNEPHFEDDNIIHRRSLTTHRLLWPELATTDENWQLAQMQNFGATKDGY